MRCQAHFHGPETSIDEANVAIAHGTNQLIGFVTELDAHRNPLSRQRCVDPAPHHGRVRLGRALDDIVRCCVGESWGQLTRVIFGEAGVFDEVIVRKVAPHPAPAHHAGRYLHRPVDFRQVVPEVFAHFECGDAGVLFGLQQAHKRLFGAFGPRSHLHRSFVAGRFDVHGNHGRRLFAA